ncbi:cobalt-precorrin-6A reductase [Clostridium sardiniense]|uniref:Cobalt-precorrin-6A reductase n=1 Tax=Clostridium sardiniense TaxID=29369 RepID=A0ABS7KVY3_CLOSR|nr:cobalt-precorrin-6A reductase [Clostridium sardiniense]MBY0754979.1 cobalt-precorrin-6A reductase [Clostridium sardiniense]MDQ0459167.1 precorrin-6A/cobalt-precorrin-6A reductase [Clostridium sardiniense]
MIGFILGTSEGKKILKMMNRHTDKIVVSTATEYGGELLKEYKVAHLNTKPLDKDGLIDLIKNFNITVLVDASHPYATEVSKNAMQSAKDSKIAYIRYEREGVLSSSDYKNIIKIQGYNELKEVLEEIDGNILNTTGSRNIGNILKLNCRNRIIHRILPSSKILQEVLDLGVDIQDVIAIKGPVGYELNKGFIDQYNAKAIITKDSGTVGGTLEKLKSAIDRDIKLIVIDKPKMNYGDTFYNETELVEHLIKKYNF